MASLVLLAAGGVLLVAAAVTTSEDLVLASLVAALAAGGLLALGVARHRPLPQAARRHDGPWSGTEPASGAAATDPPGGMPPEER